MLLLLTFENREAFSAVSLVNHVLVILNILCLLIPPYSLPEYALEAKSFLTHRISYLIVMPTFFLQQQHT